MHKSNVHEALQLQLQKSILPTKNLFPPNHEIPNLGVGGGLVYLAPLWVYLCKKVLSPPTPGSDTFEMKVDVMKDWRSFNQKFTMFCPWN